MKDFNGELAQVLPVCDGCGPADKRKHQCQDLMHSPKLGVHACGCTCLDPA